MAKRARSMVSGTVPARAGFSALDAQAIYCGDNLEKLKTLPPAFVDLVYIDPPFNSNRNYEVFWPEDGQTRAFEDRKGSNQAYIDFMRPRCAELARVLKPTGSFYFHCDWHASHYVRMMLDGIFGENQFKNEIIWKRSTSHGNVSKNYGMLYDCIFFYTKSTNFAWNQQYRPFPPDYIAQKFRGRDDDGRIWQDVTLRNPSLRPNLKYPFTASNGVTYQPHPNGWSCDLARLQKYDREGRLRFPKKLDGQLRLKMYLDESPGIKLQNLWDDIPAINSQAAERSRIGYPTQKPLPLLDRIIKSSSGPGDIVLDAFCGCGTALVSAQNLGRRWIGIDVSPTACNVMRDRLERDCGLQEGKDFILRDERKDEAFLRRIPHFEFENWAVLALGGIPNAAKVNDWGIDGRIYPAAAMPRLAEKDNSKFNFMDHWYPVQVKQKDKAGRPDIDGFVAAMIRAGRTKGYFVSFDFTADAKAEIKAVQQRSGPKIVPITVKAILDKEDQVAMALP